MNKIFKVVWSKVRNAYVVVSEIAKNTVSGVGKRNRVKRFSMGATLAAVALTSSFFLPNWAYADDAMVNANTSHYIAIGGASLDTNPFVNINGVTASAIDRYNKSITVTFNTNDSDPTNDESYVYEFKEITYTDSAGNRQTDRYWIREGFGVKAITERYHPDATNVRLDLYKIPGEKASYEHIAMTGEHMAEITQHYTAVNNVNLDNLVYIQYAGMTNSGGVDVPASWQYYIKRGENYVDVGGGTWDGEKYPIYDDFYVFKSSEYNEKTGKYTFAGVDVEYSNVYRLDGKVGVFLTGSYAGAYNDTTLLSGAIANAGIGVYGGTVYGKNNEILLSGYDSKTDTWTTVWAGEITDPNATIESMTLSEFNEILHHIHEEDVKLADSGIVSTKVVSGKDTGINTTLGAGTNITTGKEIDLGLGTGKTKTITSAGSINMVNVAGNQVPGLYVVSSGGTKGNHDDTVITFIDSGAVTSVDANGNVVTTQGERGRLTLKTGSVVVANEGATYVEGATNVLSKLTINGKVYQVPTTTTGGTTTSKNITIKDTGTNVNVTAKVNGNNTEYIINAVDTTYSLVTNATNTTTGSTTYDIKNNLTGQVIGSIIDTNTDTKYTVTSTTNSSGNTVYTFKENGVGLSTITDTNTQNTNLGLNYDANTQKLTLTLTDSDSQVISGEVVIPSGNSSGNTIDRYLVGAAEKSIVDGVETTTYTGDYYVSNTGEVELNVKNGDVIDHVTIQNVASTQALAAVDEKVEHGWIAQVDGSKVKEVGYHDTLQFVSGKNVHLSVNASHDVVVSADDYRLVGKAVTNGSGEGATTSYDGEYSVDAGKVSLNVQNSYDGDIKQIVINDVASKTDLEGLRSKVNTGWSAKVNGTIVQNITPENNTLNFVKGTNVDVNYVDGAIKISATDTNTYISDINLNGNTLIFDYNDDGIADKSIDLSGLTSTLGTMSSWKAKVGETTIDVTNGETVEYVAGNNISLSADANQRITVATTPNVSFTTVNVGNNVNIDQDGIVIENGANDIELTKTNISVGNNQIHNVAAGEAATDAVNFGQLKSYVAANDKDTITRLNEGENGSVTVTKDVNGNYTVSGVDTNTTYTVTSHDRESADASNVAKKWVIGSSDANQSDVTIVDTDTKVTGLQVTYDAAGNGTLLATTNGDAPISTSALHDYYAESLAVDGNKLQLTLNNNQVLEVELSDITAGLGTMSGWKAQVVGDEEISIANNETLTYEAGSNIVLDSDAANRKVTVALDNVVELKNNAQTPVTTIKLDGTDGSVSANRINVGNVVVDSTNNRISGLAAGVAATDAVNFGQLQSYVAANDKDTITELTEGTNGSVTVTKDATGKYTVSGVDTNTTYTVTSYDRENTDASNVAKKWVVDSSDANQSDVTIVDTDTKVTGLQVTYDEVGNGTLQATTNGDASISTNTLHDYYAESLAVDGNKLQLTLNNNQVLEVELSDITAGLGTMSGWKAQVVGDEEISIANNETLTYEAGSNIVLDSNAANKKVTVALDNVVELKNNAQNPATTIKLDGTDGSVVANHVNVGSVVVDGQTNRISGLVAGVNDNDAVNVKQLKDYVASEEVIVDGEGSVTVTKTTENDKTKYIVTAVDTKVAASEAIYESNGVGNIALKNSVDNTTVNISGLKNYYTNGFVLDSSTDQLTITRNDGKNFVVDVTNLATDYKLISNPNDTEGYTVTAGGEINLVVQDSNNANNKDVITILDVAKQSVVNSSISTINTNISTINSSINNITDAVSQHTGQITTINNKLNEHSTSINTINTSISNLNDNDINRIKFVESNVDTGLDTIQLVRNDNSVVPGSLKIVAGGGRETSVVDANGNTVHTYPDTHIIVSSTYNGVESTITLNTGSVVSANDQFTSHDFEDLEFITINGKHYKMPSYDVSSGQLIPDRDYHLVNGGEDLLTHYDTDGSLVTDIDGYKVDDYGIVTMLVQNNHNPAVHQGEVSIGNIATKTQQDTNTAQLKGTVMYDYDATTQKYDYGNIRLGETGSNINGTATTDYQKNTDGTYSGGVKVTNVAYAETDSTKNGYVGSAAVNVDLLNDKISDVALEAAKATTVTGDSNINVTESNNANGSKNYAVALNSDITLSTKEQDSVIGKVEISSSTNTVAVGIDETKEVVVNGSTGTITAGQKVTIDGTDGDARFGAVNIDGTTGTINAGQNVSINGTTGIITAGQKVTIDGSDGDATFGAVSIDGTKGSVVAGSITVNDNNNGTINGLSNTEWGGSYTIVSGQAATEDQLQKAVEQMQSYVTSNDQHIDYNKEYKVVDDKITLDVANSGGKQVVINDVASATALSKEIAERKATDEALSQVNARQDGQIANLQFVNDRQDGQIANLQFVNDRQDEQIVNLQFVNDRQDTQLSRLQEDVAQEVIDREANDIVSGKIDSDGTVTLTKGDTSTITVGKISNHMLDETPVSVKEDGTITLTATNAYDANDKKSMTISDVASKTALDEEIKRSISVDQAIINYTDARANQLDSRINQLGSKVNKVGAGAAALAALHPMDFDPDDKLSFAVGAGNYAGETATALGAFYRPNEKVMMNVAGTYGNGENMVNMGVSFALDRTNHVSNSRTAMAKEIVDLREQVATQGQQIAQLVALVQQLAGVQQPVVPAEQLFPDVPENHWAYEYVNTLVSKGIIDGYPDGTFGGDRTMTRYEFAAMLFRAMEQGVVLSEQIRQEFEKELGRVRVDRVKGADNDPNKIERVRVNKAADRDNYGSKIVQVKH